MPAKARKYPTMTALAVGIVLVALVSMCAGCLSYTDPSGAKYTRVGLLELENVELVVDAEGVKTLKIGKSGSEPIGDIVRAAVEGAINAASPAP